MPRKHKCADHFVMTKIMLKTSTNTQQTYKIRTGERKQTKLPYKLCLQSFLLCNQNFEALPFQRYMYNHLPI